MQQGLKQNNNPVRAGFVENQWDWLYSSSTNYQDMKSLIEVEKIAQRLITFN